MHTSTGFTPNLARILLSPLKSGLRCLLPSFFYPPTKCAFDLIVAFIVLQSDYYQKAFSQLT